MHLSDLIRGLQYLHDTQGDLPVLEDRGTDEFGSDLHPESIEIDNRVQVVGIYTGAAKPIYYSPTVALKQSEHYREFKAFVL